MKFCVFTLGCKVNQYESNQIIAALTELGHEATSELCPADFYIINTCSITAEADKKSRQMVARALRQNENAKIIIIGCSSQNSPSSYQKKQNVIAVYGAEEKVSRTIEVVQSLQIVPTSNNNNSILLGESNSRARAYLKIQDGCNNFCSYCIVPYLRGKSTSRTIDDIIVEANTLSGNTQEIVITGINISAYGLDLKNGSSLEMLVEKMKCIPVRKRLGSLECNVITRKFLENMKESGFCDHFHLALQSGCDDVLKLMNRHYTTSQFFNKVELIREVFPYAGITTDIITAFPTETEQNHLQTMEFIKKVGFSDIHVFPYSKREGTKAASMIQLDGQTAQRRASELAKIKHDLRMAFFQKNIGRTMKVYIEDSENGHNVGYTSNYIKVYSDASRHSFFDHIMKNIYDTNGIEGELINE